MVCEVAEIANAFNHILYFDVLDNYKRGLMPSKKEIVTYYEEEYLIFNPSLHLEGSKFKASEIFSLLETMKIKDIDTVVELGCGAGGISKELIKKMRISVVSCDISSSILKVTRNVNKNLMLIKADCEQMPIRNKFADLVLAIDILEHLKNPREAVAEIARITKRWVVFRLPIEDCLYHKVKKSKEGWLTDWKIHAGHLWKFNLPFLRQLLKEHRLKVTKVCISKNPLIQSKGISVASIFFFIVTRFVPSLIYQKLLPAQHLILAQYVD